MRETTRCTTMTTPLLEIKTMSIALDSSWPASRHVLCTTTWSSGTTTAPLMTTARSMRKVTRLTKATATTLPIVETRTVATVSTTRGGTIPTIQTTANTILRASTHEFR